MKKFDALADSLDSEFKDTITAHRIGEHENLAKAQNMIIQEFMIIRRQIIVEKLFDFEIGDRYWVQSQVVFRKYCNVRYRPSKRGILPGPHLERFHKK